MLHNIIKYTNGDSSFFRSFIFALHAINLINSLTYVTKQAQKRVWKDSIWIRECNITKDAFSSP